MIGRVLEVEIDKDRKEERVWVGASVAVPGTHLQFAVSCNKLYLQSTIGNTKNFVFLKGNKRKTLTASRKIYLFITYLHRRITR